MRKDDQTNARTARRTAGAGGGARHLASIGVSGENFTRLIEGPLSLVGYSQSDDGQIVSLVSEPHLPAEVFHGPGRDFSHAIWADWGVSRFPQTRFRLDRLERYLDWYGQYAKVAP